MARVPKVLTLTQPIWPDKTIYASIFADQPPTPDHATPQAADPSWTDLVTDYVSQTDGNLQTIISALNLAPNATGRIPLTIDLSGIPASVSDLINIKSPLGTLELQQNFRGQTKIGAGPILGNRSITLTPYNLAPTVTADNIAAVLRVDFASYVPSVNSSINMVEALGSIGATSVNFPLFRGLFFSPSFSSISGIVTTLAAIVAGPTAGGTGSITNLYFFHANSGSMALTVGTAKGVYIQSLGAAFTALTTAIGLDIDPLPTATTSIGIRQSGTVETNRLSGKTRIGDQTTPTETLEALGNILATTNLKQNTSPGSPSSVGLANSAGSSVLVPALDHVHQAAPGTVILINADETQANATVPNTDTTLKTYTLAANTYTSIIAEAEGYVQESLTTTNQNVNIKIKLAGTQNGQTMIFNPQALATGAKTPFPIKASGAFTAGGAVTVTIGAATADANTTVFLNSLRVYGVV